MVDVSEYRGNGFYSVSGLAVELVFLALHFLLELRPTSLFQGNHHDYCSLVQLGLTFIPMRAILTLLKEEGYPAHTVLFDIGAAFGLVSHGKGNHPGAIFVEFILSKNRINIFPGEIGSDQFDILLLSEFLVFGSAISAISDHGSLLIPLLHLSQVILQQGAVAGVVLFNSVVCDNRTIGSNGLFQVNDISTMYLPGLLPLLVLILP